MSWLAWLPKIFNLLRGQDKVFDRLERLAERLEQRCEKLEGRVDSLEVEIEECQKDRARLHEEIAALKANQ